MLDLREVTVSNNESIKKYLYLINIDSGLSCWAACCKIHLRLFIMQTKHLLLRIKNDDLI